MEPGLGLRALLVEDDPEHRALICRGLRNDGFEVVPSADARAAVRELNERDFDAVVCDLQMPGMDGLQLLRYVRIFSQEVAFLMLTGHDSVPTAVRSMHDGADEYLVKPVLAHELAQKVVVAVQRRKEQWRTSLRNARAELAPRIGFLRGVQALVNSLETKDPYTRDHSQKVAHTAMIMAVKLPDMTRRRLREIRFGALLHDIGKIGVPLTVLHKEGPLEESEWEIVRLHPEYGVRILEPLARDYPEVVRIVRHEHERWDGRGYPDGLVGKEIPLGARLVMIADTYDAICSTRPYRKALSKSDALDVIRQGAGSQFDPELIPIFESSLAELPEPRD